MEREQEGPARCEVCGALNEQTPLFRGDDEWLCVPCIQRQEEEEACEE